MSKKTTVPVQIEDGKWYALNPSTKAEAGDPWTEECCSCGLTHIVTYKIENGRIWVQYKIDEKRTRAARKRFKYVEVNR